VNRDPGPALVDPPYRRVQEDAVPELRGHSLRNQVRASREAALLRAARGVEVALEGALVLLVARGREVEDREEE
jgi:hypothetical protein